MSPVELKKMPCRLVEFKGQGPLNETWLGGGGGIYMKKNIKKL